MNKMLLAVFVIAIIGIGVFALSNQASKEPISPTDTNEVTTPIHTPPTDLRAGGSSYLDENGVYSILYPNDYTLDTQDPVHIRIYKTGETQRPQSEMSDGALIVFEVIDLQDQTLGMWVDNHIEEATADGTSEIIEEKQPLTHNNYPGFSYSLRGLGVSQNLVLQKNEGSSNAVLITYAVSDPEEKGYQEEIDAMLSTLQLLK